MSPERAARLGAAAVARIHELVAQAPPLAPNQAADLRRILSPAYQRVLDRHTTEVQAA